MLSYRVCKLPMPALKGGKRLVTRLLGFVVPKNDPDFMLLESDVAYWWLELDAVTLVAKREIGFEAEGSPVRYAPAGRNWGIFVGEELSGSHLSEILEAHAFETAWAKAAQTIRVEQ
jgi:hypothetical protein